jgi:hypothetical protein
MLRASFAELSLRAEEQSRFNDSSRRMYCDQKSMMWRNRLDFYLPSSAADPIPLPEPKPRAVRKHFVVSPVGSRDVAWAEWPYIGRFEHFL